MKVLGTYVVHFVKIYFMQCAVARIFDRLCASHLYLFLVLPLMRICTMNSSVVNMQTLASALYQRHFSSHWTWLLMLSMPTAKLSSLPIFFVVVVVKEMYQRRIRLKALFSFILLIQQDWHVWFSTGAVFTRKRLFIQASLRHLSSKMFP